jgi:hypothetical protein
MVSVSPEKFRVRRASVRKKPSFWHQEQAVVKKRGNSVVNLVNWKKLTKSLPLPASRRLGVF